MRAANGRVPRRYVLALALGLGLASSAAAQTGQAVKPTRIRIKNFGEVNAHYYRGAQPDRQGFADLDALGIATVIDLAAEGDPGEQAIVESLGMKFHRIPMTTRDVPTPLQLAEFLKLINDPANQPVYVHCMGGRHRTGVMTAAYRMNEEGWTADRAFAEMKRYQFGADFLHPEFKTFVFGYHPDHEHAIAAQAVAAPKSSPDR